MAASQQDSPAVRHDWRPTRTDRKRLADEVYLSHLVQQGDRVRVVATVTAGVIAALTTVSLTIGGRVQGFDGQLSFFGDSLTFVADGAQTALYFRVPEGYVVDMIISTSSSGVQVGDLAAVADLVQGEGSALQAYSLLTAGWVSPTSPLGLNSPQVTV